jgi:hypothetical protein
MEKVWIGLLFDSSQGINKAFLSEQPLNHLCLTCIRVARLNVPTLSLILPDDDHEITIPGAARSKFLISIFSAEVNFEKRMRCKCCILFLFMFYLKMQLPKLALFVRIRALILFILFQLVH